jgi:hypothetical protein
MEPKIHYRVHRIPHHSTLSSATWIQSKPSHTIYLRSILILYLPSSLFPSAFPIKILYAFYLPMHATCPVHFIVIILVIFVEEYKL